METNYWCACMFATIYNQEKSGGSMTFSWEGPHSTPHHILKTITGIYDSNFPEVGDQRGWIFCGFSPHSLHLPVPTSRCANGVMVFLGWGGVGWGGSMFNSHKFTFEKPLFHTWRTKIKLYIYTVIQFIKSLSYIKAGRFGTRYWLVRTHCTQ